ncbi:cytochrome bc1 complex cytochrome b subunit [Dermacoccus abyssi]|uniref:cytochrome bc1 complex cytochrome b subunit n=1 Tax=Dermacoccus abyssi TaxID=322596 RepID=UPI002AD5B265|nr:cytochrome bc complex cytochrome b subunit [Dermacoccus abyssi]
MSTAASTRDSHAPTTQRQDPKGGLAGVSNWIDERSGAAKGVRFLMKKVFPDHWSFMLGEVALYSFIILLITGTFLTFWFVPSMGHTTYNGSYVPLQGIQMSEAYASTLDISFDIRGGLLIRQLHHWAALLFVVSIMMHMFRVFFTGAFRKPREINWVIGTLLFMLACIEGFMGYSLPDDLLSGTGIRAMEGFILSTPIVGTYISYGLFGGGFPGEMIIPRFYSLHILLIPAIMVALLAAHLILLVVHKHTQYPGPGRTDKNVVGFPLMPVYMAKAGGFFFIVFGITALISSLVGINAIWAYGPYEPTQVTAGSQPDWYMGFADGALRLLPGFLEFVALGHTWSMNIFPGSIALLPIFFGMIAIYPWIENWVTGDKREHHVLDRPRNAPTRTAIGMAFAVFYAVLMFAAGNDIMAIKLHMSINDITYLFRVLIFVGPIIAFWVTKRICLSLQRHDRDLVLHGRESGRIVRTPEGRFFEAHEEVDEFTRWRLVGYEAQAPSNIDTSGLEGKELKKAKRRNRWTNFYFRDRIAPVTPAELEAAHHHGDHEGLEAAVLEDAKSDQFVGELHGGSEETGQR